MKFSEYYNILKTQHELNFVNIFLEKDTKLFIDPWAIRQGGDEFSHECYSHIASFFELLINRIKNKDYFNATDMLRFAHEVKEIRLGDSINGYKGLGMNEQTNDLFNALKNSKAIKTGLLEDIEDCALMIDNINRDKISDMVANIIKIPLLKYTKSQCDLHNISTKKVSVGYCWDNNKKNWELQSGDLPVPEINDKEETIILVPKDIVRRDFILNYQDYYRNEILNFEQSRYGHAGVSLVKALKTKEDKQPTKKELKKIIPSTKKYIFETTLKNSRLLDIYKKRKSEKYKPLTNEDILNVQKEELDIASKIGDRINELQNIKPGKLDAGKYHNLVIGILELLFFPYLSNPKKEFPLNGGKKFVDISFLNKADSGFFMGIVKRGIPSHKIFFECKNYTEDPKNPEVDQLSGRLGVNTSKIGFLVCRTIDDQDDFMKRTKFALSNKSEYLIGLTDNDLINLLNLKKMGGAKADEKISNYLENKIEELIK